MGEVDGTLAALPELALDAVVRELLPVRDADVCRAGRSGIGRDFGADAGDQILAPREHCGVLGLRSRYAGFVVAQHEVEDPAADLFFERAQVGHVHAAGATSRGRRWQRDRVSGLYAQRVAAAAELPDES